METIAILIAMLAMLVTIIVGIAAVLKFLFKLQNDMNEFRLEMKDELHSIKERLYRLEIKNERTEMQFN